MSTIREFKVKALNGAKIMVEQFSSANEVVEVSSKREITDISFCDMPHKMLDDSWHGVKTFQEALDYMKTGYQPTVDKTKQFLKNISLSGTGKRVKFSNQVVGFAPIVPLALQGVPTCMMDSKMAPIKTKVIDVYYDMVASSMTSPKRILEAGQNLLGAILKLEAAGYRINLYAVQTYTGSKDADMMVVKIKSSNTPIDLKRISFPLTHPAFFRVIGFDWYSKTPKGKYRSCYGHAMAYEWDNDKITKGFEEMFGRKCVVFNCSEVVHNGIEHFEEAIKNAGK